MSRSFKTDEERGRWMWMAYHGEAPRQSWANLRAYVRQRWIEAARDFCMGCAKQCEEVVVGKTNAESDPLAEVIRELRGVVERERTAARHELRESILAQLGKSAEQLKANADSLKDSGYGLEMAARGEIAAGALAHAIKAISEEVV